MTILGTALSDSLAADARVGVRRLLRAPWFAVVAVVSIAISTAAIAAMSAVVGATELRNLPYVSSERLSTLYTRHDSASAAPGSDGPGTSYATFGDLRRRLRSFDRFEAVSVVVKREDVNGTPGQTLTGRAATPGFLSMLSVKPTLGRWIAADDTVPGAERVVVLSYDYWLVNYGGDVAAIGRQITFRDRFPASAPASRYTIIGVLPREMVWDQKSAFWVPLGRSEPQTLMAVSPIGVIRSDVTLRAADAEVRAIGRDLGDVIEQTRPPGDKSLGGKLELRLTPLWNYLHDRIGGRAGRFALFGLAVCVLILAVANVLSLNLLDAQARRVEFAVRSALGASRQRLARQTLIETAVLALPACLIGLIVSPPLIRLASDKLKIAALGVVPSLDTPTVLLTILVALLIAVIVGLTPGLIYAGRDFADGTASRGNLSATRRVANSHRLLVVIETAMAIVVLTGAGLVVKELSRLAYQELGYSPSGLTDVSAPIGPPRPAAEVVSRGNDAAARVEAIPGVAHAALMATDMSIQLRAQAMRVRLPATTPRTVYDVTPNYFDVLEIPLMSGRRFGVGDDASQPDVVILSLEAARRLFPNRNPIGEKLALASMGAGDLDTWATVIGLVADARVREDPISPRQVVVYRPFGQGHPFTLHVVAQAAQRGAPSLASFRDAVKPLAEGTMTPWSVTFLEDDVRKYLAEPRFTAVSLSGLALVSLSLAIVGIFGVTAYAVSLRTREIAIRIALGANANSIVTAIVRDASILVALGLFSGILLAVWMSRLLQTFLHGTNPFVPSVYVGTSLILLGTSLIASLLPARRALTIDPARALRFE